MKNIIRRSLLSLAVIFCLLAVVFALGPQEPYSGKVTFDAAQLGSDLDVYLEEKEKRFDDIRTGLHKQIIWADPSKKQKTEFAIVYVHGYTASLAEVRPLPDQVADNLGANLYYTRLKGHGRTSDAMAEARADDWLTDTLEAVAIGERLGERVIVISTSMGSSLVSLIATNRPELTSKIAGYIMISPNFKIAGADSMLLTWPWARSFVPMLVGEQRGQRYENEKINHGWTLPHAAVSLMPMAKITSEVGKAALETLRAPALFIYSPKDEVVSAKAIEKAISKWGGPADSVVLENSGHIVNHIIVGDILSPDTTDGVVTAIKKWINRHF